MTTDGFVSWNLRVAELTVLVVPMEVQTMSIQRRGVAERFPAMTTEKLALNSNSASTERVLDLQERGGAEWASRRAPSESSGQ